MNSSDSTSTGATVVITHQVRDGKQGAYESWLGEIGALCRAAPGHLDSQIIRPITGLTATYTIVIRFDTADHLRQWMESADRRRLIETVRPSLAADDHYTIRSGLDFWFNPPGSDAKVPVRWKQFLITWSAIYPLVLGMPLLILPVLRAIGVPDNPFLSTLVVTGALVALMVYVVMPHYTRLVRHWLFD
jgi:antibiotic biosynthesis monooxygenase (ABM) superfamily enzyme